MIEYQNLSLYKGPTTNKVSLIKRLLYSLFDSLLIHWTPKPFNFWRNCIYRLFGAKIGKGVRIDPDARITAPWNLEIGDNVWIGFRCVLYGSGKIHIGNNVSIAHNVFIASSAHDIHRIEFPTICEDIIIEDQCWIASNVFIQMGVTMHRGSVAAACSLVTRDIPEGMIAMGIPAKPVKERIIEDNE